MEIKKININKSHVAFIDNSLNVNNSGLTKEDFILLLKSIEDLPEERKNILNEDLKLFNKADSDQRRGIGTSIKKFLADWGIAIAQNLTTEGIIELGKILAS